MKKKHSIFRRGISLGLAMLLTLSSGISAITVNAEETENKTVKVTAQSVEHATIKLNDSEEQEIDVSPGSEVKIDVETDSGYQLDDIWAEDSEGYKAEVTQKEESYFVTADTDLTIKLGVSESHVEAKEVVETETISAETDAKDESKKEDQSAEKADDTTAMSLDAVTEEYIRSNINEDYARLDKFELANVLLVKQTMVDGSKLGNLTTIDEVITADNVEEIIYATMPTYVSVYNVSDDSDYLVAYANTMQNDNKAEAIDNCFAYNNNDGQVIDSCIYDTNTGLAYIPKSLYVSENGSNVLANVQLQLLQKEEFKNPGNVKSDVTAVTENDENLAEGSGKVSVFACETSIKTSEGLSKDEMVVSMNGIPLSDDDYRYNSETGEIKVEQSSAGIQSLSVKVEEKDVVAKIKDALEPMTVKAAESASSMETHLTFQVPGNINEGDYFTASAYYAYGSGDVWTGVYGYGAASLQELANLVYYGGDLDYSRLEGEYNQLNIQVGVEGTDWGPLTLLSADTDLKLMCSHISNPLGDAGVGPTSGTFDYIPMAVRILSLDRSQNYMVLGLLTKTTHTQAGCGVIRVAIPPSSGKLKLKKVSSNPDLTNGNPCYSLEGAEYGVYTDTGCTNQVATLTTDADGNSNTVEVDAGTFYVREISASKGYKVDDTKYTVTVTSGNTATVTSKEVPTVDPLGITITKIDQDSNGTANVKSLEGAQFEVKYYAVNPDDYNSAEDLDGIDATRTWVLETKNKDGLYQALLDDEHKVSGDDFYYNNDEVYCIPIGVITIEETTAPEGYKLEGATFTSDTMTGPVDGKYFAKVFGDGEEARLDGGNSLTASDQSIRGGIKVAKWDKESNAQSPQGEATLESTTIEIINKNDYEVVVNGQAYGKDQTVMTLTTDANGDAQTAHDALPYGLFEVKETGAPSGYLNTGDSISQEVFIAEDGVIVDLNNNTNAIKNNVIRGGVKLGKWDNEFNAQTPQGNATLEGAEFAIISENSNKVIVNGKSYQKGETVATLKTDANGNAQTSNSLLPYGTYTLKETKAPTGYLNTGTNITQKFSIRENGVIVDLNKDATAIKNNVIRGGVKLGKWDNESNTQKAQGAATLEGAEFEIVNQSSHDVIVNGKTYKRGQVVATLVTNKKGIAESAKDLLPYGKYSYEETKAPKGYLATGSGLTGMFTIKENGVIVDLNKKETAIKNNVIRGDITFTKSDAETSERMANIPFKITSNTTGESHIIYTDENGYYSSESKYVKHSENTNAGKAKSGTWFGLDVDGKQVPVKDSVGAFPYDTYTIQELRCDANADKALFKGTFTISMHGFTIDYGTITNSDLSLQTTAKSADTNTHKAFANDDVTIVDSVFYTGLKKNQTYTIKGIIMDKETNAPLLDVNGDQITAETTFKAPTKDGITDVTFNFDGTGMEGKDVVVFEECYDKNGDLIVEHKDIEDEGQTIHFEKNPEIQTSAKDSETQDHISAAKEKVSIVDTVTYKNLKAGKKYTVSGTLMDKETGRALINSDGEKITAETTFTAEDTDGTVEVTFTFDASDLAGKTTVVFEELYRNGKLVATHSDIEDEGQTIYFPEVKTTAKDSETDGSLSQAKENVTIVDTVDYKNLIPGKEYTVQGTLMDQETGEKLLDADGKEIVSSASFTAEKAEGSVDVTFTFDASKLAGKTTVVFEDLYYNKNIVATHADITDEGQSVHFPKIKTTAKDAASDSQNALPSKETTIIDTVKYTNLIVGKTYTVKGLLMDKDTNEPFLNTDGKQITGETTFTAEETSGEVEIKFTFDSSALKGKTIVVFEDMYESDHKVATHSDITDEDQSVHFPEIGTTAKDSETNGSLSQAKEEVTIEDTVSYKNLVPNKEYTVQGTLMDQETGKKLLDADGKEVTAETTFTPEKAEGETVVTFTFNASNLAGKTTVVFEDLYDHGKLVATHSDITDEGQTIHFPEVKTSAKDAASDSQNALPSKETTIIDTVKYTNLIVGKTYTVKGTLMDKDTKEPLLDGLLNKITGETTFTATETSGEVEIKFTFDSSALKGKTIVVFEDMYESDHKVATHSDITDKDQSVHFPEIKTTATDKEDGDHTVTCGQVTIVDTIKYENLVPGKEYKVSGVLMDKSTGEKVLVNKKEVTAETSFTPEKANGTVEVTFTFDASSLEKKSLVVFEKLYDAKGNEIANHEDINDEDQTVTVSEKGKIVTSSPSGTKAGASTVKTGDVANAIPYIVLLGLAIATAIVIVMKNRKMKADEK